MFARLEYTWDAMRASWEILKENKGLLLFPFLSGVACLVVMASFLVPVVMADAWEPPAQNAPPLEQVLYYGMLFVFYFVNYFIITFFNSAVAGAAVMRLCGKEATLGDAFQASLNRLPQIFGWAFVAATVGFVLKLIEQRSEKVGAIVSGLSGAVWSLVTFLVVPVLVVEGKGPIAAFQRSASLLRKTWGDQLVGNFGFGLIFFLLTIPAFVCVFVGFALGGTAIGVVVAVLAVIYLIVLSLVQSTLQTIFQSVLYVYATYERVPESFNRELLAQVMVHK